jgi:hypothetical protein
MVMTSTRSKTIIATMAGLLVLSASGAPARGVTGPVTVDLTASAQPHAAGAHDTDLAFHVDNVQEASTHAATTATTSSVCDGCSGEAVSVQVMYVDHSPVMKLDNVAVAWTQDCSACDATAVSLQVVVVSGPGALITANRALALNAACDTCNATSGAYQLVVSGNAQSRFTAPTLRSLEAWATWQARLLSEPSVHVLSQLQQKLALRQLALLVNAKLGTGTMAAHARVTGH